MLKVLKKSVVLMICGLLLSGCQKKEASPSPSENFYQFTDDNQTEIILKEKPQKVAVLFSSFAEIWSLCDGEVSITVQESVDRGFASASAILVDSGAGKTINSELLIESQPDLIICTMDLEGQRETAELMKDAGIPTACFHIETFDDYLRVLKIFAEINENEEAYNDYGIQVQNRIKDLLNSLDFSSERDKILFIRAGSSASSTKAKQPKDHFAAEMLNEIHTYNIAENAPVLLDGLSVEEILKEDPKFIFVSTMGKEQAAKEYFNSVLKDPLWQSLSAVQNDRVYYLPKDLFQFKPNQRWADAYEYLIELVYGYAE